MFDEFDGSGRPPRAVQTHILRWLETHQFKKVLAINAPTGVGKSAILRSIQVETQATGIVPTNNLLDQYRTTYPHINYLKGFAHYDCSVNKGFTCQEAGELDLEPCDETCVYRQHKSRAMDGESTIFNPISYHYQQQNLPESRVLVVDEAHKLVETLMLLTGCSFRKSHYNYPDVKNDLELMAWMGTVQDKLERLLNKQRKEGAIKAMKKTNSEIKKIGMVLRSLKYNPQDFVFYTKEETYRNQKDEYLYVLPVNPPKWLLDQFLACETLVLMSATLMHQDVWDLGIDEFEYLDVASPIPKDSRPVMYRPYRGLMNYKTPPEKVAEWIYEVIEAYPDRNTIVHLSYTWVKRLKDYFPDALTNTPETKDAVLAEFKAKGGVWLAAGCAEGIDLPGDECRLNIIPIIVLGNPTDPVIKKQLAQPRGQLKYSLHAIKTVIQQVGRSTRGIDDHSISVIGDSKFPALITKYKQYIPKSFLESIVWRSK